MNKIYWQGDVGLEPISKIPEGTKKKDNIVAYGEATGHHHRFETTAVQIFADKKGEQFAKIKQESELIHEEHKPIMVPKGVYRVIRQRVFDVQKGIQQVMD